MRLRKEMSIKYNVNHMVKLKRGYGIWNEGTLLRVHNTHVYGIDVADENGKLDFIYVKECEVYLEVV